MLLPLDIWRAEIGLPPWAFWGMAHSQYAPIDSKCSPLTFEYAWQGSDAAGRDDLRRAIDRAEEMLKQYLHYRVAPEYSEATVAWPRHYERDKRRLRNLDAAGMRISMEALECHIRDMGVEARTLIGTAMVGGGTLVYSDADGDGLQDTFTITLPTTVTDTSEIAVYFAAADRLDGAAVGERWRINPLVRVTISGGNVVIAGRKWLLVRPILYETPRPQALDPTLTATFVTSLEIYRRYTDTNGTTANTSQAALVYESRDCGGWGSGYCCDGGLTASTDPASIGLVVARAGIRDRALGLITPAASVYNSTTGLWSDSGCCTCYAEPDRVILRYLAGYPLESGQMAKKWQQVVTKLATAELKRRICACRESNERLHDLQQDMTLESTQTERYAVSARDLDCPFGTRRGHIQAWKESRDYILRRGITA